VRFLVTVFATLLDPLAAAGYVIAGLISLSWWQAVIGGATWAIAINILSAFLTSEHQSFRIDTEYLIAAIVGYSVAALAVYGIRKAIRENKERRR
jgi:hypothetical protein